MDLYPPSTQISVYAVLCSIGILLTALRLWVRLKYTQNKFGVDDLLIAIGLVITCACIGAVIYNAIYGASGNAVTGKDAEEMVLVELKFDFATIFLEKFSFGAIKLSLLFFYRRVFGVWESFRRTNNALIVVIVVWAFGFTMADILLCGVHPELYWAVDQTLSRDGCGSKGVLLLSYGVTSVVTDVLVLGLPLVYLQRVQMPGFKKFATALVFLLGCVSTLASILRAIFLCVALPTGRLEFGYEPPPNEKTPLILDVFNPTFWVMVEMCLGLWAANLPALAPLLKNVNVPQVLSGVYRKLSSSGSGSSSEHTTVKASNFGFHGYEDERCSFKSTDESTKEIV